MPGNASSPAWSEAEPSVRGVVAKGTLEIREAFGYAGPVLDERKAALIRALFAFCLILAAIAVAFFIDLPGMGRKKDEDSNQLVQKADSENIGAIRNQKDCVVVLHAHEAGNIDSEKLREILRQLKKERYGDIVQMAEFDVEAHPDIAAQEGVNSETAPQLGFYIEGQRVGDYRGPWRKRPVQIKIDTVLRGYMQRIGKEWRPPVPGMKPDGGQQIIPIRPPDKSTTTHPKTKK